jgi:hypothetical protein
VFGLLGRVRELLTKRLIADVGEGKEYMTFEEINIRSGIESDAILDLMDEFTDGSYKAKANFAGYVLFVYIYRVLAFAPQDQKAELAAELAEAVYRAMNICNKGS